MSNKLYPNEYLSQHITRHSNRVQYLLKQTSNTSLITEINKVVSRRGYKPNLIEEKSLSARFQSKGYGPLISKNLDSQITTDQLQKAVETSRNSISKDFIFKGSYSKLFSAADRVKQSCKFPKHRFEPLGLYDGFEYMNKSASSGFPHFKPKGQLKSEIINEATIGMINDPEKLYGLRPTTVGFRAQLRKNFNDISVKLRIMYPITAVITLYETCFTRSFIEHFSHIDTFFTIGRTGNETAQLLKSKFNNCTSICSLDVKAFDQSMPKEIIILAFYILRSQLRLNPFQSKCFDFCVQYFISSLVSYKVGSNPVCTYVKVKGIPSGSGFTNIIGTLTHAIILEYLCPDITKSKALICADDNIFDSSGINTRLLFKLYKKIFNLTISKEKTSFYTNSQSFSFLGFYWNNFERFVDEKLVINQCIWHTQFRTDLNLYDREIARCASTLLNGKNGSLIFKKVFPDIMNLLRKKENIMFRYLTDNRQPLKLLEFEKDRKSSETNESLIMHLKYGYLIR